MEHLFHNSQQLKLFDRFVISLPKTISSQTTLNTSHSFLDSISIIQQNRARIFPRHWNTIRLNFSCLYVFFEILPDRINSTQFHFQRKTVKICHPQFLKINLRFGLVFFFTIEIFRLFDFNSAGYDFLILVFLSLTRPMSQISKHRREQSWSTVEVNCWFF